MAREPRRAAANAAPVAPPSTPVRTEEEESVIEDRGSFSHGVCRVCGWAGPGRRSRQVARGDAMQHVEAEHTAADDGLVDDDVVNDDVVGDDVVDDDVVDDDLVDEAFGTGTSA